MQGLLFFMNTDADLKKVNEILEKYNQMHLLQFYDELTPQQQQMLINQILSIPFDQIFKLYEKSKFDVYDSTEEIEPIEYTIKENLTKKQLNLFKTIGKNTLKNGDIGIITLAGRTRFTTWIQRSKRNF